VSDPYEEPLKAEIVIDTDVEGELQSADRIFGYLVEKGFVVAEPALSVPRA
jgi:adenylylsulfate kinase-like enzyme